MKTVTSKLDHILSRLYKIIHKVMPPVIITIAFPLIKETFIYNRIKKILILCNVCDTKGKHFSEKFKAWNQILFSKQLVYGQ